MDDKNNIWKKEEKQQSPHLVLSSNEEPQIILTSISQKTSHVVWTTTMNIWYHVKVKMLRSRALGQMWYCGLASHSKMNSEVFFAKFFTKTGADKPTDDFDCYKPKGHAVHTQSIRVQIRFLPFKPTTSWAWAERLFCAMTKNTIYSRVAHTF